MCGIPYNTAIAIAPIPSSRVAKTRNGCRFEEMSRGNSRLPRHIPPMNVPSSTPRETAVEPMTSCSSWSHTISYTRAAHPLPMNSGSRRSRRVEEGVVLEGMPWSGAELIMISQMTGGSHSREHISGANDRAAGARA